QLLDHSMKTYQFQDVLVYNPVADVYADTLKIGLARYPFHQHSIDDSGRLDVALESRHAEPAFCHQAMERVLVVEWESLGVGAVTAQNEWLDLTVAVQIDEPGRPPPQLTF